MKNIIRKQEIQLYGISSVDVGICTDIAEKVSRKHPKVVR